MCIVGGNELGNVGVVIDGYWLVVDGNFVFYYYGVFVVELKFVVYSLVVV